MLKTFMAAAFIALAGFGTTAAHETTAGDLTIIHAKARPNLPNRPTAAYMVIANDGETADKLIGASSTAFGTIELHTVEKKGDVMQMLPVTAIDVPAGDSAVLEPGGFHLMLFEGTEAFKIGQEFPVTLTFENAGDVAITVKVEKITGGSHGEHGGHGSHSGHGTTN